MNLLDCLILLDTKLTTLLSSNSYTSSLIITPSSKYITELLLILFLLLSSYELFYWSGIYLNLWDYHAKDIFKPIPIHCAHVYVNVKKHTTENNLKNARPKSIKYHLEFSPEDFSDPVLGLNILNLKKRVLVLIMDLYKNVSLNDISIFKSDIEVKDDKAFLCQVGIETGGVVDAVIRV